MAAARFLDSIIPIKTASYVMTCALFVYMCMQPLFGALSDRIGRRNNMLLFGALGALGTVPILSALQVVTSPIAAFLNRCVRIRSPPYVRVSRCSGRPARLT